MRVAIDIRKLRDYGIGTYVRNIVTHIPTLDADNEYVLISRPDDIEFTRTLGPNVRGVISPAGNYSLREQFSVPAIVRREKADVFHAPHYVLPPLVTCPSVVTIHDCIHLMFPQYLPNRLAYTYARTFMWTATHRAAHVLTVSEASKRDILRFFRRLGVPVPGGTTAETLQRLTDALAASGATQVVFLGDLLHAARGVSAAVVDAFARWRAAHPARVVVSNQRASHAFALGCVAWSDGAHLLQDEMDAVLVRVFLLQETGRGDDAEVWLALAHSRIAELREQGWANAYADFSQGLLALFDGRPEEASRHLATAVERGFGELWLLDGDPRWHALRGTAGFAAVRASLLRRIESERAAAADLGPYCAAPVAAGWTNSTRTPPASFG